MNSTYKWYKSPQKQRWALYGVLALSLGFSLSMNPEHFNNIARSHAPGEASVYELASENPTTAVFQVNGKNYSARAMEVKISDAETITQAVVEEMCDCADKKRQIIALSSNINNFSDWSKELMGKMTASAPTASGGSQAGTSAPQDVEKQFEQLKQKYDDLARKCDEKSDRSSVMNCHTKTILEYSKEVAQLVGKTKSSSDHSELITEYFVGNLQTPLKRGFNNPTFDPMTGEDRSERLSDANEMTERLIGGLHGKNGRSVIQALTKMKEGSYRAQLINSERMVQLGRDTGNPYLENMGIQGMNANALMARFQGDFGNFRSALEGNRLMTPSDREDLSSFSSQFFGTPVSNLLSSLRNYILKADFKGKSVADVYASFPVSNSGLEGVVLPMPTMPGTPGMPNQNGTVTAGGNRPNRGNGPLWDNNNVVNPGNNTNWLFNNQQHPQQSGGRASGRQGANW